MDLAADLGRCARREALSRDRLAQPRSAGPRAALQARLTVRRSAVQAATGAQRQLHALVTAAPEALDGSDGPVDDAAMRRPRLRWRLKWSLAPRRRNRMSKRPPWYGRRVASEPGYVFSPGGWTSPRGVLPAWSWVPPDGAKPRLDVVPWWVQVWYELPLIDRYAHAWMWSHGGWEVRPPSITLPGDQAGVRERRGPVLPGVQPGKARAMPQEDQQLH
jgi:hypothetical protein